jgi:hypothetical protein
MTRVVQTRRNRQTGTLIDVIDRRDDHDGGGDWETICVEHGTVCSHETRSLALYFAPSPLDWCETCMEEAGPWPA